MEIIDEYKIFEPKTIWGINNIIQIGLLSFKNKFIIVEPNSVNQIVTNSNIDDGKNQEPKKNDWFHDPVDSYYIDMGKMGNLNQNLNTSDAAWHSNSENDMIDFNGSKTTEFYKLYFMDISILNNKGFKQFDPNSLLHKSAKHWLGIDKSDTSYTVYYRIFYRTWDDYLTNIKCSSNNLNLDNYKKNTNGCKTYIDNNKKQQWVANTCVREKISESDLFGLCNQQLVSDLVETKDKIEIIKKQMEWCKVDNRLLDKDLSGKCRIFWNTNYNNYYRENERKTILDKYVKDNLCKPGHNNYPFCNCINNEKNTVQYTDANGQKIKVPDICLKDYCQDESYKTSDYNQTSNCPSQCIQIAEGKYATLKDVTQSCTINQAEQTKKTDITEESNNLIPGVGTIIDNNVPKDKSKSSLFNLQNDNIKSFMNQLNINTIETSSYLLNEEDIFILGIIFIFILLFIISKVTDRKYEPNYSYYPNQMYYDSYPNQIYYP